MLQFRRKKSHPAKECPTGKEGGKRKGKGDSYKVKGAIAAAVAVKMNTLRRYSDNAAKVNLVRRQFYARR